MSQNRTILLVEDDQNLSKVLQFHLEEAGHKVLACGNGKEALEAFGPAVDLVLTDINMPSMDGLELLKRLKEKSPKVVVVVLTAYGSTDKAVAAMQAGAFHYVEKPVHAAALLAITERALQFSQMQRENTKLKERAHEIISASPRMMQLMQVVEKVAGTDHTVLISGESGTGKELVARGIHVKSERESKPFIAVNCAAIPDDLLESTLFGHAKGAFTGAHSAHEGKFVQADKGTLFLDEIGEMSLRLQAKLLRVLQDGEVEAVGGKEPQKVDVRIVAATNQDLSKLLEDGDFREDLYYRLNVVPLQLPPLRQRKEDIPVLLRFFLRKHSPAVRIEVDPAVDQILLKYPWKGNVRELENLVKRMIVLRGSDTLSVEDVPPEFLEHRVPQDGLPFELPADQLDLRKLERDVILAALELHQGNQSATARYLNIPRHILLHRLEKMDEEHE